MPLTLRETVVRDARALALASSQMLAQARAVEGTHVATALREAAWRAAHTAAASAYSDTRPGSILVDVLRKSLQAFSLGDHVTAARCVDAVADHSETPDLLR